MDAWHEVAMTWRGAYLARHRQANGEFARHAIPADGFVVPACQAFRRLQSDDSRAVLTLDAEDLLPGPLAWHARASGRGKG